MHSLESIRYLSFNNENLEHAPLIEIEGLEVQKERHTFLILMVIINLELHLEPLKLKRDYISQSGRIEFIEKYYEVISEFIDRGYAVAMMDWRGQGLSSRVSKNIRIGHIDNFKTFDGLLYKIVEECFKQDALLLS